MSMREVKDTGFKLLQTILYVANLSPELSEKLNEEFLKHTEAIGSVIKELVEETLSKQEQVFEGIEQILIEISANLDRLSETIDLLAHPENFDNKELIKQMRDLSNALQNRIDLLMSVIIEGLGYFPNNKTNP